MTSLAVLLAVALSAAAPMDATEHWLLACHGRPPEVIEGSLDLEKGVPEDLRFAWYWSDRTAPRKIEAAELPHFEPPDDEDRLEIRVPPAERPPAGERRVIAAPARMWIEIPEPLLPTWPVPEDGTVIVPIQPDEVWRVRFVEPGRGTWWTVLERGQPQITLSPLAARDLVLTVVDPAGEPIPGGSVRFVEPQRGRMVPVRFWATYRFEDGSVSIPSLPDGEEVAVLVGAEGFVNVALDGRPHDLPSTVVLDPGATVSGRFVTEDKKPIAGAEVEVESWIVGDSAVWMVEKAESDGHGRWQVPGLRPGKIVVRAQAAEYAPFLQETVLSPNDTDLGDLVLDRAITVKAFVFNTDNQPVAGAEIRVKGGATVTTDDEGHAEIPGVSPKRPLERTIVARGHARKTTRTMPPIPPELPILLQRIFMVTGVFLDADGVPVSGGVATAATGHRSLGRDVQPGGYFELDLEPRKKYEVRLNAPTTAELRFHVEPGEAGEERDLGELRAPWSHVVTGRLIRAADGAPVAQGRVWLPRPTEKNPLAAWFTGSLLEARSDHIGAFTIKGLVTAPARVRIDAPGFARRTLDVRPEAEVRELDLGEIELTPGVTVRVLAGEAAPRGAVARIDLGNQWLEMDMLTAPVNEGTANVRNVPPGDVILTVMHQKDLLCETLLRVPAGSEQIEVECEVKKLRVTGVVKLGGYAVGPGRLSLLPPPIATPAIINKQETAGGLDRYSVFGAGRPQVDVDVAADGYFVTAKLRPGAWDVAWFPSAGGASESMQLELPDAEEVEIVVDFPARTITGVVVDPEEKPVAEARVRELSSGALVFAAADGTFRLIGMKAGTRYLRAELGGERSATVAVEVGPDEDPEPVRLVFGEEDSVGELKVQVIAGEIGVPGAFVIVEPEGGGQRILTTDGHGRATTSFDPPFPPRLRFAAYAAGTWVLGAGVGWAEVENEPVVLEIGPTGAIVLTAESHRGTVRLVSTHGWDVAWLLTRLAMRPIVTPEAPLIVGGLPAGTYELTAGDETVAVSVSEGRETEIEMR